MEAAGVILIIALLVFGASEDEGVQIEDTDTVVQTEEIVEQEIMTGNVSAVPVFTRGQYYKSENGYYISDLSIKPSIASKRNCSVLVADLSQTHQANNKTLVTEVKTDCGG